MNITFTDDDGQAGGSGGQWKLSADEPTIAAVTTLAELADGALSYIDEESDRVVRLVKSMQAWLERDAAGAT